MILKVKPKTDTAERWETFNPVLAEGELGYDSTNKILKIGDGATPWSSLKGILEVSV